METRSVWSEDGKSELGILVHEGKEYPALGSLVTETHAVGYPTGFQVSRVTDHRISHSYAHGTGKLLSWGGKELGSCRVVRSWRMPLSCYTGSHMYQIEACIAGIWYTGRGFGNGMLWRGKRSAKLNRR